MKRLHRLLTCVAFLVHSCLYAQEPQGIGQKESKPALFSSLPDSFEVDQRQLQKIFTADVDAAVSLPLTSNFAIEGKVISKNQHTPGSITSNLRLSNYKNALFNVTLRLMADNSTLIQGRVIHPRYADILILYKIKDRYYLKKSSQQTYMPE